MTIKVLQSTPQLGDLVEFKEEGVVVTGRVKKIVRHPYVTLYHIKDNEGEIRVYERKVLTIRS